MIVIYTQDETIIKKDADSAKKALISVYGEKFGAEAYDVIRGARYGGTYRKNGGPLIKVVTKEQAKEILRKESVIGMM